MEFKFADVGEGITEGEIVRWHVSEGDEIEKNQTLVEVETDKAIVDIPSPCDGIINELPFEEGERIQVGETLAVIESGEEDGEESDSTTVVGEISSEAELLDEESEPDEEADEDEILATPKTRKLAEELGIDLEDVEGTGNGGRITPEDVRAASRDEDTSERETERVNDNYGTVEVQPLRGVRKRIAERMETNHEKIPQVTHMDKIDVTELVSTVEEKREQIDPGFRLTMTPFFVKAAVQALRKHPELNASFDPENRTIRYKKYYNIGLTVDTDSGLIVPVIKDAHDMDLLELGEEITRLARRARQRALDLSELQGATFTITNIGFIGGTWATPQVNHPQAGILATGEAQREPSVVDDNVIPRTVLPVSLSFDHRILDGADAARFVNTFGALLQEPSNFTLSESE